MDDTVAANGEPATDRGRPDPARADRAGAERVIADVAYLRDRIVNVAFVGDRKSVV